MTNTRTFIFSGIFLAILTLLNGCGTVKGFGQDVSTVGHDIKKAAS